MYPKSNLLQGLLVGRIIPLGRGDIERGRPVALEKLPKTV